MPIARRMKSAKVSRFGSPDPDRSILVLGQFFDLALHGGKL